MSTPTDTPQGWKRVVITGGAGFIGSHLADACCRLPGRPRVTVIDNLRSGRRANLDRLSAHEHLRWIEGDINDEAVLDQALPEADCVFHMAAMISVAESMVRPLECVRINVDGTLKLLEAARRHGVGKVVLSSSAAVYGDEPGLPKHEAMRPFPISPYGITKLDGEYYLDMFRREHGISTVSLRYFNVYGPHQDPNSAYAAAIPLFVQKASDGAPIGLFGDGLQTRDFIYVRDVVRANLWTASDPAIHGVFNVATGRHVTVLELAQEIRRLTGSASEIVHLPPRAGDIRDSWSDPSKLQATGFSTRYDLASGLAEMLTPSDVKTEGTKN